MSDEKEKKPVHPETFFLPPLKMILAFFDKDKESRQREKKRALARERRDDVSKVEGKKEAAGAAEKQEKTVEKNLAKLIEKLSEKDE